MKHSEIFKYELSPLPSLLFDEYGDMRKGSKSVLLLMLAVFAAIPLCPVGVELVDDNELSFGLVQNAKVQWFAERILRLFLQDTTIFTSYLIAIINNESKHMNTEDVQKITYLETTKGRHNDTFMESTTNKCGLIDLQCNTTHDSPQLQLL